MRHLNLGNNFYTFRCRQLLNIINVPDLEFCRMFCTVYTHLRHVLYKKKKYYYKESVTYITFFSNFDK